MIVAVAILRDVRYDNSGLIFYVDIRSNLGLELTSKEFHGFNAESDALDLELALISRIEQVCKNEFGIPIDQDHTVRLLTKLR